MALTTGTIVAVRDSPTSVFHLARITALTEANTSLHYLGTTNPRIEHLYNLVLLHNAYILYYG
jgi:hypothetical protein